MNKKLLISISLFLSCSSMHAEITGGANREPISETVLTWVRELYTYWTTERVKTKGAVLLGLVINGQTYQKEFIPDSFSMYDGTASEIIEIRDRFADGTCCVGPIGNLPQFRGLVQQDPAWQTLAVRYSLRSGVIKTESVNLERDFIAKQDLVVHIFDLLMRHGVFQ